MKRSSILILALVFAATAAQAANGPKVSPNVRVNDPQKAFPEDNPGRNTATLAASQDGFQILAGWDDFQGFCGEPSNLACPAQNPPGVSGYGFSLNGGHTWTDAGSPPPIDGVWTAGHSWADRGTDEKGLDAYFFTARMRSLPSFITSEGIGIYRGRFTHDSFIWENSQIINSSNPNDFYGRQSIAAAKDGSGAAYIALANIDEICGIPVAGYGQIELWRTHDGGLTWNGPVVVSPDTFEPKDTDDPNCGATGYQQVIPVVSIGPGGQVYVVWQYGPFNDAAGVFSTTSRLAFSRSLDGGVTFSAPEFIVEYNNNRSNPPVGYAKNRLNDQPRMAVATTGHNRGRIYVTFYAPVKEVAGGPAVQSNVSSQIYLTWSDDQGRTWSDPKVLVGEVPDTGVKRFWPTPTVRPNGDLDIVYMESQETQVTADPTDIECSVPISATVSRKGPLSSLVDLWWIQSRDGGATFSAPLRVSSETSNWCEAKVNFISALYSANGDYLGIASAPDRTLVAWPDNRSGEFVDIFFATVKGTAKPPKP